MVDEGTEQNRPNALEDGAHNKALPYPDACAQGKEPGDIGGLLPIYSLHTLLHRALCSTIIELIIVR